MCYWAQQTIELCSQLEDESLAECIAPVESAMVALRRDRRVVFIGGKECGKSSLLAAVAGCSVMEKAAWEGEYVCWRYRCDDGDATCSRFLPEPALEGLELVDTVSCETAGKTVAALLPGADVVVAVMDARAVQDSSAWALLADLPAESSSAVIIALTHTDALSAESVVKLGETVRDLCRARLPYMPAACHVSPANAAAVEVFTARVQEVLGASHGVRAAIRRVQEAAESLLYKQGSLLKKREEVMRMDNGFMAAIEQEIDNFLMRQKQGAKKHSGHLADSVLRVKPRLLRSVKRALGFFLSPVTLLRLELFGAGVEKACCRMAQEDACRLQEESDLAFIQTCAEHWKNVRPRMKQTLEFEIGEFPEARLAKELADLRSRLKGSVTKPFLSEQVRRDLSAAFRAPIGWMQGVLYASCVLMGVAGATGYIGQDSIAEAIVLLALLLWCGGSVGHLVVAKRLRGQTEAVCDHLHKVMEQAMEPVTENLVVSRVTAYRNLYTQPRLKVAAREMTLEPLRQTHSKILRSIRTVGHF